MNTTVTATAMQIYARTQGGIVISDSSKNGWSSCASSNITDAEILHLTSNANNPVSSGSYDGLWFHDFTGGSVTSAAQQSGNYKALDITLYNGNAGVGYVDENKNGFYENGVDPAYFIMNRFYIKSSGEPVDGATLYINSVDVSCGGVSQIAYNSLRVCVVVDGTPFLFAPVSIGEGPTLNYTVKGSGAAVSAFPCTEKNVSCGVISIPGADAEAIPIEVYVYFEGEDASSASDIISLDAVTVNVQFGTTAAA
ncbi:MAG: hypothetical protein J5793_04400 [Clostridia bacterium]|nr:hypothetical protein [Clostridia bacterium]